MTYFAKINSFGSETDAGFANTWQIASFETKAARDAWVAQRSNNMGVDAVTKKEALQIAGAYQRHQHANGGYLANCHYLTNDNINFTPAF